MSERWISERLARTSGLYKGFADRIKADGAIRASGLEKVSVKGIVRVPLGQGQTAKVWESGGKIKYFCSDNTVTMKEIQRQTARAAQHLLEQPKERSTLGHDYSDSALRVTLIR